MDTIHISGTAKTLDGNINFINGIFKFKGRSIEEDPRVFFKSIELYIELYLKTPAESTLVYLDIEYINSSSIKLLLELLKLFKNNIPSIGITWVYEDVDESMFELGEMFEDILNIKLNFIEKKYKKAVK